MSNILTLVKDIRVSRNIVNLVEKIVEHKSIQLWSISDGKREFERSKSIIDGSLKNGLDTKKISDSMRAQGIDQIKGSNRVILLHDESNIRKPHAEKMENLGKVRDLNGNLVNGYDTFNTVALDENEKVIPLDISVFSNGDDHFVTEKETVAFAKGKLQASEDEQDRFRAKQIQASLEEDRDINLFRITQQQLERVSKEIKKHNPDVELIHILDRRTDGNRYFKYIDGVLHDLFINRIKVSRNSDQTKFNKEKNKEEFVKLVDAQFTHSKIYHFEKVSFNGEIYENVKCDIEYDKFPFDKKKYTVIRITLTDKDNKNIFKNPMLLIAKMNVESAEQAFQIYRLYLKRAKIETVFKFLKSVLGWEQFQVEDYESIKNIIALCYFVGAYFYIIESHLIDDPVIKFICLLGGGKGVGSRYFFIKGLAKILIMKSVERFIKEHNIDVDTWNKIANFFS